MMKCAVSLDLLTVCKVKQMIPSARSGRSVLRLVIPPKIIEDVIHRLVTMGVFTPNNSAGLSGNARTEQGGVGETGWHFAEAAGSDRLVTPDDASSAGGGRRAWSRDPTAGHARPRAFRQ